MSDNLAFHVFDERGDTIVVKGEDALNAALKSKSDASLRREAIRTNSGRTQPELQAAALAKMEIDRRFVEEIHKRADQISSKTTWVTVCAAVVAALFGAVLGAVLSQGL